MRQLEVSEHHQIKTLLTDAQQERDRHVEELQAEVRIKDNQNRRHAAQIEEWRRQHVAEIGELRRQLEVSIALSFLCVTILPLFSGERQTCSRAACGSPSQGGPDSSEG